MPNLIKVKKGLDLRLIGEVKGEATTNMPVQGTYALFPDDYHGIIPKIAKKEGEAVKAGEQVIFDKSHTDVSVVSPVNGLISAIIRGERRKIERVEITCSENDSTRIQFDTTDTDPKSIVTTLQRSGLWVHMRQRPYDVVPDPDKAPRDIFITAFDSAPLASRLPILEENAKFMEKGVQVLSKLTQGKVYICCREENCIETPCSTTYNIKGPHPAGNPGVQIAAIKPVNKGETVWTLNADTAIKIGQLFTNGSIDWDVTVAVTGECVKNPMLIKAKAGVALKNILCDNLAEAPESCRIISGNVLTGMHESMDGFLHFPFRQITVIPENMHKAEFMGWASLNPNKYSFSRCFFSWLESKKKKYHFDAKINGGERAIIMAGEYDKVFPMDIYSEFLIKAIMAKDIDKMEQLGIYEVAPEDFALCEFIDTSKLELQKIVRDGLDYLRKEMN